MQVVGGFSIKNLGIVEHSCQVKTAGVVCLLLLKHFVNGNDTMNVRAMLVSQWMSCIPSDSDLQSTATEVLEIMCTCLQ